MSFHLLLDVYMLSNWIDALAGCMQLPNIGKRGVGKKE